MVSLSELSRQVRKARDRYFNFSKRPRTAKEERVVFKRWHDASLREVKAAKTVLELKRAWQKAFHGSTAAMLAKLKQCKLLGKSAGHEDELRWQTNWS